MRSAYPKVATIAGASGVAMTEVDDIVEALRAGTDARSLPKLHCWPNQCDEYVHWSPERIVLLHPKVCEELRPAFPAVVRNHVAGGPSLVLKGDCIAPQPWPSAARAVYLVEDDEAQIVRNYASREPSQGEQTRRARVCWLLGQHWAEAAREAGIPVISPRPWKTLPERLAEA